MSARDEARPSAAARTWKVRLLALSFGTLLAFCVFVGGHALLSNQGRGVVETQQKSGPAFDALIAARKQILANGENATPPGPWRWWVDETTAQKLFPMRVSDTVYDPYCYFRHADHLDLDQVWSEHSKGIWHLRTNGLGLREDHELNKTVVDVRVLVTGDSHTDGVCENSESFANVLEASLVAAHPGKTVDVINAGKGGFSFYNYMGVLQRFLALDLKPRVFIVAVYGGNDFEEALTQWHYFNGSPRPQGAPPNFRMMGAAKRLDEASLSQGMLSLKYFNNNPAEVKVALDAALFVCAEIITTCRQHEIAPIFVYVPATFELDSVKTLVKFKLVLEALQLALVDLQAADTLAADFLAGLEKLGATTLDMRPTFRAASGPLYWELDHHINVDAHALIARQLAPLVERVAFERP